MICIFEWKRESQLKCKKCFSSTTKRDQHWLEEKVPPDNDLCFVKFQSMILSPASPPSLPSCFAARPQLLI